MQAFLDPYIQMWKNYANFKDRTTVKGFWFAAIVNFIVSMILSFLSAIPYVGIVFSILSLIYSLAIIIPGFAIGIRRMHDVGKCGWFILIPIYNIVLTFMASVGDNQYGPAPQK